MTEKRERSFFFIYLSLLLLGEIFFYTLYKTHVKIAYYPGRNPFYRKCWKEYLDSLPQKKKEVFRILFISNSQGYGKEFAPDQIVSAWMEKFLNGMGKRKFEVFNLSIGGGQSPEFLFLLAYSKKLNPNLIIFSLSPANFGKRVLDRKLEDFVSDVPLELYGEIPDSFFDPFFRKKYLDFEFKLNSFFYRHFKSYPISSLIVDEFSMKFKKFKKFINPTMQKKWIFSKKRRGILERKKEERIILRKLMKKKEDIDEKMVDSFCAAIEKNGVPVIFINQPVRRKGFLEYEKYFFKFNYLMNKKSSKVLKYVDLSRKVDDHYFFDNVHLTLGGHRIFGKKLAEIVINNLTFFK